MEKVDDVLGQKFPQFNSVSSECLVSDALYQMCCENVDHLIVFDSSRFIGIITEHDIASKVLFDNRPLNVIPVKEFVNRTLPVASSNDTPEHCLQLIERYHAKHLAIFDSFTFKGVVSSQDLMQQAFSKRPANNEENGPVRTGYPWNY